MSRTAVILELTSRMYGSSRTASIRSGSVTKYGDSETLVEAHALDEVHLHAEGLALFDGDDTVFADLVDGVGDHLTDLVIGGRDGCNLGDLLFVIDWLGALA